MTRLLGGDHDQLDAVLVDAKRALAKGDVPEARARFGEFRDGLERHIACEEQILFPVFEELTGSRDGPTAVMRAEHLELRRLLAEVATGLEVDVGDAPTTALAALTARIYAHNGKEERILYPTTDRLAREAGTLDALMDRLRAVWAG